MTQYKEMALKARREVSKLTLAQQQEILKIYEDTIDNLAAKAAQSGKRSLTRRWALDYKKSLEEEKARLQKQLNITITQGVKQSADYGIMADLDLFKRAQAKAGIDLGDHFTDMFSQVPTDVIEPIISGELYKDHRSLSSRIWSYTDDLGDDLDYVIKQGIAEKKSAIDLAKDLERFVWEPAKRPTTWGKVYPRLMNKQVDYNAMRLARTAINHSYQTATIRSASMNPFVEGIEWQSALIHGRTCELCRDRHGQVFPVDDVPLDHPNGLCTMLPVVTKSIGQIADELKAWQEGNNPELDSWFVGTGNDIIRINNRLKKIAERIGKTTNLTNSQRRALAQQLLKDLNLGHMQISIRKINEMGRCEFYITSNRTLNMQKYILKSDDMRSDTYKIKTMFHEAYHAKANGLKTDYPIDKAKWLHIEETFAESSAHYLTKQAGITAEISPSYPKKLVDVLPRLKRTGKFKDCKTIADFGKIAWNDRIKGNSGEWLGVYNEAMKVKHDWVKYTEKYIDYIDKNKEELIDVMLENMPQSRQYRNYMINDVANARVKIKTNDLLTSNEEIVMSNLLAIAMNRLGVK